MPPPASGTPATTTRISSFSNYINRFHDRHTDLMDVLSLYGGRGSPLDELARLLGLPGQDRRRRRGGVGELPRRRACEAIRDYCEADCVNTYLLFLRFQLMRCAYTRGALPVRMPARARQPGEAPRAALAGVPVALEELVIDSLDAEGRGVARNAEGKVRFVEGALPGERVAAAGPREKALIA